MKALGLRPRAFICFSVFGTRDEALALVFDILLEKSLSPPLRTSCEGSLSIEELTNSVKSLNTGKLPGSDGLSVKFYLRFWETLVVHHLPKKSGNFGWNA